MARYKKRKDGRYATTVTLGYDTNGKRKQKCIYGRTVRELERKVAEAKKQIAEGGLIDDKGMTVKEWMDKWYKVYKEPHIRESSRQVYRSLIAKLEPIGKIKLKNLRRMDIQQVLNTIAPSMSEQCGMVIRAACKAAVIEGLISRDPSEGVRVQKHKKKEKRALTDEEVERVISAPMSAQAKAYALLMLTCGLRKGEASAVTKQDIHGDFLQVEKTLTFIHGKPTTTPPKTATSVRAVPILPVLRPYLEICGDDITECTTHGKSYQIGLWEEIAQAAKLPSEITPHYLRHTYATRLYYAGVDVKTAQQLLGHTTVKMTMDIYTHCEGVTDDMIGKMSDSFGTR